MGTLVISFFDHPLNENDIHTSIAAYYIKIHHYTNMAILYSGDRQAIKGNLDCKIQKFQASSKSRNRV